MRGIAVAEQTALIALSGLYVLHIHSITSTVRRSLYSIGLGCMEARAFELKARRPFLTREPLLRSQLYKLFHTSICMYNAPMRDVIKGSR